MPLLELDNLHVALEDGTEIVNGVDLSVEAGEVHALMGPNGSGKSTLAYALMGHPSYRVSEGRIVLEGEDVTEMEADARAHRGLFLAFQYPHAVPGVTVANFLRTALNANRKARGQEEPVSVREFANELRAAMRMLGVPKEMAGRYLNEGFSGGEKKRVEILQMAMLKPRLAVLDETDSGLDIDALRVVAGGVQALVEREQEMGALVITHYQRILHYLRPTHVHVFASGRVVASGGPELAERLEREGYAEFLPEVGLSEEAAASV